MIEEDLRQGALVEIALEDAPDKTAMPMSAVYRTDARPGPAGRWMIERLKLEAGAEPAS
ncbi:MAG: hypothetical protein JO303_05090 [Caulobacteraceae bacterium]|nr:hypothetical protein [Caulobacteraceae bacterium]